MEVELDDGETRGVAKHRIAMRLSDTHANAKQCSRDRLSFPYRLLSLPHPSIFLSMPHRRDSLLPKAVLLRKLIFMECMMRAAEVSEAT